MRQAVSFQLSAVSQKGQKEQLAIGLWQLAEEMRLLAIRLWQLDRAEAASRTSSCSSALTADDGDIHKPHLRQTAKGESPTANRLFWLIPDR